MISIHVPAWGTTTAVLIDSDRFNISIHVPAWGTTMETFIRSIASGNFNPRSRVGNDGAGSSYHHHADSISIHVPAWGTTYGCSRYLECNVFQSTFPRGERQSYVKRLSCKYTISIHVPAWGTTGQRQREQYVACISIHVPAWGTTADQMAEAAIKGISIHVPAWGTTGRHVYFIAKQRISIHVPAWGTTPILRNQRSNLVFQSTFPRGERHNDGRQMRDVWNFNPRSRVGNDGDLRDDKKDPSHFNPRSRVGNDRHFCRGVHRKGISIHVPAWGTTSFSVCSIPLR